MESSFAPGRTMWRITTPFFKSPGFSGSPGQPAGYADHFLYGFGGHGEIVLGCRVFFRQAAVIIFKIRKPDVDAIGKLPDGFSPLIAAAVIDHGDVKLWPRQLQGLADGRGDTGWPSPG